jgi:hypothetical protein
MTPAEKARELFDLYLNVGMGDGWAKDCALIAVDEIKEQLLTNLSNDVSAIHAIYWEKVKQELQKL